MANIRNWIERFEEKHSELIECAVVGKHYNSRYSDPALEDENIILSREVALNKLDAEYCNGYGGADCFPFYAWTESWVLHMDEYDGATGMRAIPRNPVACVPEFCGGDGL